MVEICELEGGRVKRMTEPAVLEYLLSNLTYVYHVVLRRTRESVRTFLR